jgi:hypothetical protein
MCKCTPNIRTPWCGKPGCEMPGQKPAGARQDHIANGGTMVSEPISDERLRNTRAWAAARPDMSGSGVIVGAIDELLLLRERQASLDVVATTLQYWLDYQALHNPTELLNDDRHIVSPPSWPSRGTLKNWIAVLRQQQSSEHKA